MNNSYVSCHWILGRRAQPGISRQYIYNTIMLKLQSSSVTIWCQTGACVSVSRDTSRRHGLAQTACGWDEPLPAPAPAWAQASWQAASAGFYHGAPVLGQRGHPSYASSAEVQRRAAVRERLRHSGVGEWRGGAPQGWGYGVPSSLGRGWELGRGPARAAQAEGARPPGRQAEEGTPHADEAAAARLPPPPPPAGAAVTPRRGAQAQPLPAPVVSGRRLFSLPPPSLPPPLSPALPEPPRSVPPPPSPPQLCAPFPPPVRPAGSASDLRGCPMKPWQRPTSARSR